MPRLPASPSSRQKTRARARPASGADPRPGAGAARGRLIDAAVEMTIRGDAVTTGKLAREVGIVQSGFYAHFDSIEGCLQEIARTARDRLRAPIRDAIATLRDTDPADVELLTGFYVDLLERVAAQSRFMVLFLRRRRDETGVGRLLREFEAELERDLVDHLEAIGLGGGGEARTRLLARLLIAQSCTAAEAWLDGARDPALGRDALARLLAGLTSSLGPIVTAAGFA